MVRSCLLLLVLCQTGHQASLWDFDIIYTDPALPYMSANPVHSDWITLEEPD